MEPTNKTNQSKLMRSTIPKTAVLSLLVAGLGVLSATAQPTVLTADPRGNPTGIYVVFSEPMDTASAQATGNYSLANAAGTPVSISSATLAADQTNLFLQLGGSLLVTSRATMSDRPRAGTRPGGTHPHRSSAAEAAAHRKAAAFADASPVAPERHGLVSWPPCHRSTS